MALRVSGKHMDVGDALKERIETRLVDVEKRLTRQYSALDVNLSRITSSFAAIQGLLDQGNR